MNSRPSLDASMRRFNQILEIFTACNRLPQQGQFDPKRTTFPGEKKRLEVGIESRFCKDIDDKVPRRRTSVKAEMQHRQLGPRDSPPPAPPGQVCTVSAAQSPHRMLAIIIQKYTVS